MSRQNTAPAWQRAPGASAEVGAPRAALLPGATFEITLIFDVGSLVAPGVSNLLDVNA